MCRTVFVLRLRFRTLFLVFRSDFFEHLVYTTLLIRNFYVPHWLRVAFSFWVDISYQFLIRILDFGCGSRYGYAAYRGRIVVAVNSAESLLVVFGLILGNDSALLCRRRGRYQPICPDFSCEQCRLDLINLIGLTKDIFEYLIPLTCLKITNF